MPEQLPIPEWQESFLEDLIKQSIRFIQECSAKSKVPLIIQYSGGRDSQTVLQLVREAGVTNYVCAFMATGTELPGVVTAVREFCKSQNITLLVSNPGMHKGNLFKRIEQFKSFPNLGTFEGGGQRLWCCRDLKLRPQKKLLVATFGKGNSFYRLEGIRRFESERRKNIYAEYAESMIRPDDELANSYEVFPILSWTDSDVLHFIEMRHLPTLSMYKDFGVSGCSWCPFYPSGLYYNILQKMPNWIIYSRIIDLEIKLNQPSVHGIFLRDIKKAAIENGPLPISKETLELKKPCTIILEGKKRLTCDVYGHLFIETRSGCPKECFRCGQVELEEIGV